MGQSILINLASSGAANLTAKTVGDFIKLIALPAGGRDDPDGKVMATDALFMAYDWLARAYWSFWHLRGTEFTTTAGTADYSVPTRIRSIYNMRVTAGSPRTIFYIREDEYDRARWDQTANGQFTHYTLSVMHQSSVFTLLPTPDAAETVNFDYYRNPAKNRDPQSVPDLASYMEDPAILYAQGLTTLWKGRPDSPRFFNLARAARTEALSADRDVYDEDVRFKSPHEVGQFRPDWRHPFAMDDIYW